MCNVRHGGLGMVDLLEQLFSVIWQEEIAMERGLSVNYLRRDREDPGNYIQGYHLTRCCRKSVL